MEALARSSSSLVILDPCRFEIAGERCELPRYLYLGPSGGTDPIHIGVFAGLHGDEPAGSLAIVRFVRLLESNPELARGYCLHLYPVCNPTGFEDGTRHSRRGRDLNREFWRDSREPEVRLLEQDLRTQPLDGLIALHSDDTSSGLYGFVAGALLTQHLLRPALDAAAAVLPLNQGEVIDGFPAQAGIIRHGYEGVLSAPPEARPRPFEIVFETPHAAPLVSQEEAFVKALAAILTEYRQFIAYGANL